jgi:CRISPR/Cas system-associated exonuclease Cas4 (RecB family)
MKTFTHAPIQLDELTASTKESGERIYLTPSGRLYPSVTTILSAHTKEGLDDWREKVGIEEANRIGRRASEQGSRFHSVVEDYLKNKPIEKLSIFDLDLFSSAKVEIDKIDNILAQESSLYSDHLRLAGRVDCIADYDGKLSIIDFKTSKREKPREYIEHYFMQTAAYAIMFEERTKIPISNLVIIIAVEDGFVQVWKAKRDVYVKDLLYYRDLYEANAL